MKACETPMNFVFGGETETIPCGKKANVAINYRDMQNHQTEMEPLSSYHCYDHTANVIRNLLDNGMSIGSIFKV